MGATQADIPPLVNAPTPAQPLPFLARRKAARRSWIDAIPASAYEAPVHVMRTPMGAVYLINDPDGVRRVLLEAPADYPKHDLHLSLVRMVFGDGLLGSDGEAWRFQRRTMAPAFEPRAVAALAPAMTAATGEVLAGWDALPTGGEVDIFDEMLGLALRIVSRSMFSSDSAEVMGIAGHAMREALAIRPNLLDLAPLIGPLRQAGNRRRVAGVFARLDAAIYRLIAERQAMGEAAPRDLLTRLIEAEDPETGQHMTARDIRDQVVTIFLAGHETTAVALGWLWYVLSRRPDAEARLYAELEQVLQGAVPTSEDIGRLPFMRALIQEVMRLYPPVPTLLARRAVAAETICGVAIPKNAIVGVTPWILHRHRRHWTDPERFDPERFLGPTAGERPRLAYIPFGAGPRICIGAQLALAEVTLAVAAIARRYRLRLVPGQQVELRHRITLRPAEPLKMILERR